MDGIGYNVVPYASMYCAAVTSTNFTPLKALLDIHSELQIQIELNRLVAS